MKKEILYKRIALFEKENNYFRNEIKNQQLMIQNADTIQKRELSASCKISCTRFEWCDGTLSCTKTQFLNI